MCLHSLIRIYLFPRWIVQLSFLYFSSLTEKLLMLSRYRSNHTSPLGWQTMWRVSQGWYSLLSASRDPTSCELSLSTLFLCQTIYQKDLKCFLIYLVFFLYHCLALVVCTVGVSTRPDYYLIKRKEIFSIIIYYWVISKFIWRTFFEAMLIIQLIWRICIT